MSETTAQEQLLVFLSSVDDDDRYSTILSENIVNVNIIRVPDWIMKRM